MSREVSTRTVHLSVPSRGVSGRSINVFADPLESVNNLPSGLFDILQPITDASHTRNRKRSPPDSACFPGTRLQVVKNVNKWARSDIMTVSEPHVRWMHGYVGSGKSSISQEVCETSKREDRPVVSFFSSEIRVIGAKLGGFRRL